MHTITFTCETITPMFLSGADGTTPELRAPSIKGALRFWWRAMNGHLGLGDLKKQDEELWGDTKQRCEVNIIVTQPQKWEKDKRVPLEENDLVNGRSFSGNQKYLFYSLLLGDNVSKNGFPQGSVFDITFSSKNEQKLIKVVATFWLLSFLGGLGTRSRRGGGNFIVLGIDNQPIINKIKLKFWDDNSDTNLINFMSSNLKNCCQIFKINPNPTVTVTNMSILGNASLIIPTKSENINKISQYYKGFRSEYTGNANLIKKAAFGLPLTSVMPPKRPKENHTEVIIDNNDYSRRSSPIIFRIVLFNNLDYWICLKFNGNILNDTVSLIYPNNNKETVIGNVLLTDELLTIFLTEYLPNTTKCKTLQL